MKKAIIIFQKNARLGKVKTRLAKDVGDEKALEIYQFLTNYTHEYLKEIPVDKFLYYSDYVDESIIFPPDYYKKVQQGNDLGERMYNAFQEVFENGYDAVTIIGTDCYEMKVTYIEKAFTAMENVEFVLGPAEDGGYYLLGATILEKKVFTDKNWSTDSVFNETIKNLNELAYSYYLLPTLSDIDTIEDLKTLKSKFDLE